MNKRTRLLKHVLDVGWIVGVVAVLLELFVFRDTGPLFNVLLLLLYLTIIGGYFYRGIESRQKAKTEGRDVAWWKESDVVFAFGMALLLGGGLLSLLLGRSLLPNALFEWTASVGIVVILFSFFLGAWRFLQAWRRKRIASSDQEKRA
jgi:hypothetical protein